MYHQIVTLPSACSSNVIVSIVTGTDGQVKTIDRHGKELYSPERNCF